MKKTKLIKLSNGLTVSYNSETGDGYDDVYRFYTPKIKTLVRNWKTIPYHDEEDLFQICSLKLSDALKQFDTSKNINFSTYVYTIWNRKMAQLMLRYKGKKYSGFIKNDNYVHFNYPQDKKTGCQLLRTGVNKCPIYREKVSKSLCSGCEYNKGFMNRSIAKGNDKGKVRAFSKCDYFKTIIEQRGFQPLSLDKELKSIQDGSSPSHLIDIISCKKQSGLAKSADSLIDMLSLKDKISAEEFSVVSLVYEGFNKSQIIKTLKINSVKLEKIFKCLSQNEHILDAMGKR